mmetsp:Transcript_11290/g.18162  ORF Transcript_11290/g.18162 Transcript_11290/m.18162 type:complete len:247 (-) Transcript_11290:287-1027(-)
MSRALSVDILLVSETTSFSGSAAGDFFQSLAINLPSFFTFLCVVLFSEVNDSTAFSSSSFFCRRSSTFSAPEALSFSVFFSSEHSLSKLRMVAAFWAFSSFSLANDSRNAATSSLSRDLKDMSSSSNPKHFRSDCSTWSFSKSSSFNRLAISSLAFFNPDSVSSSLISRRVFSLERSLFSASSNFDLALSLASSPSLEESATLRRVLTARDFSSSTSSEDFSCSRLESCDCRSSTSVLAFCNSVSF